FQAEDGIRYRNVTGVQTCALPISVAGVDDRDPVASVLIEGPVAALDEDRSRILDLIGLIFVEDVFHGPSLAIGFEADILRAHLSNPLTFEVGGAFGALLRVGIQLLPRALRRLDEVLGRTGRGRSGLVRTDIDGHGARRGGEPADAEDRKSVE